MFINLITIVGIFGAAILISILLLSLNSKRKLQKIMRTENHSAELRAARRTNPRLAFSGVQEEPYANYVEDGWILYPKDEVEPQDLQHSKTVFNERIKFRTSKPDLSFTTTNFRTIKPNLDFTTTNFR